MINFCCIITHHYYGFSCHLLFLFLLSLFSFFFFNDTATTEIYTLSLHDALPIFVAVLAVILIAKPAIALLIVLALGYSVRTALTVAIGLAQIGEFSFILADGARKLDLLPAEGQSLLVAGALLSIGLNPLLFRASGRIESWLQARPAIWGKLNRRAEARVRAANAASADELARRKNGVRAIVVGYGPVGQTAAKILEGF